MKFFDGSWMKIFFRDEMFFVVFHLDIGVDQELVRCSSNLKREIANWRTDYDYKKIRPEWYNAVDNRKI